MAKTSITTTGVLKLVEALEVVLAVVLVAIDDVPEFPGVYKVLDTRVSMSMDTRSWPLLPSTVPSLPLGGWFA